MDTNGFLLLLCFCFLSFVCFVELKRFILPLLASDCKWGRNRSIEVQSLLLKFQIQNVKSYLYLILQQLLQAFDLDVNGLTDEIF